MHRHRHGLIPILGQFQYLTYLDFREDSLRTVLLSSSFLPSFNLFFGIGVQSINNVVIVSGEQCKASAIHIHVSISP